MKGFTMTTVAVVVITVLYFLSFGDPSILNREPSWDKPALLVQHNAAGTTTEDGGSDEPKSPAAVSNSSFCVRIVQGVTQGIPPSGPSRLEK